VGGTQYTAEELLKEANEKANTYDRGGDRDAQTKNSNDERGKPRGDFDDAGSLDLTRQERNEHQKTWKDNIDV
jgi:hypothetical protein